MVASLSFFIKYVYICSKNVPPTCRQGKIILTLFVIILRFFSMITVCNHYAFLARWLAMNIPC